MYGVQICSVNCIAEAGHRRCHGRVKSRASKLQQALQDPVLNASQVIQCLPNIFALRACHDALSRRNLLQICKLDRARSSAACGDGEGCLAQICVSQQSSRLAALRRNAGIFRPCCRRSAPFALTCIRSEARTLRSAQRLLGLFLRQACSPRTAKQQQDADYATTSHQARGGTRRVCQQQRWQDRLEEGRPQRHQEQGRTA